MSRLMRVSWGKRVGPREVERRVEEHQDDRGGTTAPVLAPLEAVMTLGLDLLDA